MAKISEQDIQINTRLLDFIDTVDRDWLKELGDTHLINAALDSFVGRRLLMRWLLHTHQVVPNDVLLNDSQSWLLLDRKDLHTVARQLGEYAYANFLRKVIDRSTLRRVRAAVSGEYLHIVNNHYFDVTGLDQKQFKDAIDNNYLSILFISTGVACLKLTVADNEFYKARLQWSFPKSCWDFVNNELSVDIDALSTLAHQLQLSVLGVSNE